MLYVYLLASQPQGTLYAGMTDNLVRRETLEGALRREKQIKEWRRAWKISLIEENKPYWIDLYQSLSP
jgi:putative endonuclease